MLLTLATLLAAALRLPFLDHQSLWFDEIYTRDVLGESSLAGLWHHIRATESTPPLYYLLAWGWTGVLGRGAAAMRAIPALALIAAVPVSYTAFRRLIGQRVALATAALVAVSPILVSYSTDARSYGLFVLTALLSVWGFSVVLERGSRRDHALWALASVACIWTHYFGGFVVGGEVIVLLVLRSPTRGRIQVLVSAAAVVLCSLPLLPLLLDQTGDERAAFIAGIPLRARLTATVRQFAMGPNVPRTWLEAAGIAILAVALVAGAVMTARSGRTGTALVSLTAFVFLAPLLLGAVGIEDRFYARNVVAAVPLGLALAAPALLRLGAVPLVAYLALALLTSIWVATDWRYEQLDWGGALARVEAIGQRVPVVLPAGLNEPVVRTYLGRHAVRSLTASRAWITVEPIRAPGHRALGPAAPTPLPAGFAAVREIDVHGFRLELIVAPRPLPIVSGQPGVVSVLPGG